MQVESSPAQVTQFSRAARQSGRSIGVVPTMGALHAGHLSLIECARRDCDTVMTTIFVNPTQFGPQEDFAKYPRTLDADLELCRAAGSDLVFTPKTESMYAADARTTVRVAGLTDVLEGASRPGHFDGVTTIVAKLLNVTEPDRAYFGRKDYQQQLVIRRMVRDLDFAVEVITCPTIREPDGLALSSRNRYLSAAERETALQISRTLRDAVESAKSGVNPPQVAAAMRNRLLAVPGLELDYCEVADGDSLSPADTAAENAVALIAARVGTTRLIDNEILTFR